MQGSLLGVENSAMNTEALTAWVFQCEDLQLPIGGKGIYKTFNSMGLNCMGPVIHKFFSINTNSTVNVFPLPDDTQHCFSSLLFCKNTVYNTHNTQNMC